MKNEVKKLKEELKKLKKEKPVTSDKKVVSKRKESNESAKRLKTPAATKKKGRFIYKLANPPERYDIYDTKFMSGLTENFKTSGKAWYGGKIVNLSSKYECDSFVSYNLHSYVNALDATDDYVFVGLRTTKELPNAYSFKEGKSIIKILDMNLNEIKELTFELGNVLQIKLLKNRKCYVLFNNGTLACFNYNTKFEVENWKEIAKEVNRFDADENIVCYSDMFSVYRIYKNSAVKSRFFRFMITDLILIKGNIFVLNIKGRKLWVDEQMEVKKDFGESFSSTRLQASNDCLVVVDENSVYNRVINPFSDTNKLSDKLFTYCVGYSDGSVASYFGSFGKEQMIFKMVDYDTDLILCTNYDEFGEFIDTGVRVAGLHEFKTFLIVVYDNGLIFKLFIEEGKYDKGNRLLMKKALERVCHL